MYYLIILLCMAAISVLDLLFAAPAFGFDVPFILLTVCLNVVAVIAVDGISAFVVRWLLPKKWFGTDRKGFAAGKKESRFLERVGIKKWKDKIPELGGFTSFHKNKIADPKNNEYVSRYITEANFGVAVHLAGIVCGFFISFLYPLEYCLCFGLPVAFVNAVYNGLSLAILRYNLPKLHTLYRINEKRRAREERLAAESAAAATAEKTVSPLSADGERLKSATDGE